MENSVLDSATASLLPLLLELYTSYTQSLTSGSLRRLTTSPRDLSSCFSLQDGERSLRLLVLIRRAIISCNQVGNVTTPLARERKGSRDADGGKDEVGDIPRTVQRNEWRESLVQNIT